jgi:hypothetical protein
MLRLVCLFCSAVTLIHFEALQGFQMPEIAIRPVPGPTDFRSPLDAMRRQLQGEFERAMQPGNRDDGLSNLLTRGGN